MTPALVAALLATASGALAAEAPASRADLVAQGEAALAHLDPASAEQSFDRAASLAHAADAELGLVRTYMQAGEYRRALAFIAHTAGAHIDETAGAGLQAWLLFVGGQRGPASRFLTEAMERRPDDAVLHEVRRQLDSQSPVAQGILLAPPARFAPYGSPPFTGVVSGTGWLFDGGRRALVPLTALKGSSFAWVRNATGSLSRGVLIQRDARLGVASLRLNTPMQLAQPAVGAPRDPFAGAVAYSVGYVESSANPAWPILRAGFFGSQVERGRFGRLDFDGLPARRSGPVFDAAGRFVGLALDQGDLFVPISRLEALLGDLPRREGSTAPGASADEIYERALTNTLQVITPGPR